MIWNSLEKGIQFENSEVFIKWNFSLEELKQVHHPEIFRNGETVEVSWGKQSLLEGIEDIWTTRFLPSDQYFKKIALNYVGDSVAFEKFNLFKEHLLSKLGEPTEITEEDGDKSLKWSNGKVYVFLYLFEMHAYHCDLIIGTT